MGVKLLCTYVSARKVRAPCVFRRHCMMAREGWAELSADATCGCENGRVIRSRFVPRSADLMTRRPRSSASSQKLGTDMCARLYIPRSQAFCCAGAGQQASSTTRHSSRKASYGSLLGHSMPIERAPSNPTLRTCHLNPPLTAVLPDSDLPEYVGDDDQPSEKSKLVERLLTAVTFQKELYDEFFAIEHAKALRRHSSPVRTQEPAPLFVYPPQRPAAQAAPSTPSVLKPTQRTTSPPCVDSPSTEDEVLSSQPRMFVKRKTSRATPVLTTTRLMACNSRPSSAMRKAVVSKPGPVAFAANATAKLQTQPALVQQPASATDPATVDTTMRAVTPRSQVVRYEKPKVPNLDNFDAVGEPWELHTDDDDDNRLDLTALGAHDLASAPLQHDVSFTKFNAIKANGNGGGAENTPPKSPIIAARLLQHSASGRSVASLTFASSSAAVAPARSKRQPSAKVRRDSVPLQLSAASSSRVAG